MDYPKQLMTISELQKLGYSRRTLERWVQIRGFPARKSGLGDKAPWKIDTKAFEEWQKKKGLING